MKRIGGYASAFVLLLTSASLVIILTLFVTGNFDIRRSAKVDDVIKEQMLVGDKIQVLCRGEVLPYIRKDTFHDYFCKESETISGNKSYSPDPEAKKINLKVGQRARFVCDGLLAPNWSSDRTAFDITCEEYPFGETRVFVTSSRYTGDLGGLSGADSICQKHADNANLGGRWKAWISNAKESASDRLRHSSNPYVRVDGKLISNDWKDLTDGDIVNSILLNEYGGIHNVRGAVWTSTNPDGTYTANSGNMDGCQGFTAGDLDYSSVGHNDTVSGDWTKWSTNRCDQESFLYCFEVHDITTTPIPTYTVSSPTPSYAIPTPTPSVPGDPPPTSEPKPSPTTTAE